MAPRKQPPRGRVPRGGRPLREQTVPQRLARAEQRAWNTNRLEEAQALRARRVFETFLTQKKIKPRREVIGAVREWITRSPSDRQPTEIEKLGSSLIITLVSIDQNLSYLRNTQRLYRGLFQRYKKYEKAVLEPILPEIGELLPEASQTAPIDRNLVDSALGREELKPGTLRESRELERAENAFKRVVKRKVLEVIPSLLSFPQWQQELVANAFVSRAKIIIEKRSANKIWVRLCGL